MVSGMVQSAEVAATNGIIMKVLQARTKLKVSANTGAKILLVKAIRRSCPMGNQDFKLQINRHHNQWCLDNGYPVKNYKPQAGRPKLQAASLKVLQRQAYIIKPISNRFKI